MQQKQPEQREFSKELIAQDIWHAVYLRIPPNATHELLDEVHYIAQYCHEGAAQQLAMPSAKAGDYAHPGWSAEHGASATMLEHQQNARQRIEELEALDLTLVRLGGGSLPLRDVDIEPNRKIEAKFMTRMAFGEASDELAHRSPGRDDLTPPDDYDLEVAHNEESKSHAPVDHPKNAEHEGANRDQRDTSPRADRTEAKPNSPLADKFANVEVSDRMSRLLDAEGADDHDLESADSLDQSHGPDNSRGGGHGRSR